MATFTVSPGVTTNELDQTFLTGQPIQAGAAIIGPTVKGPWEMPTLVTSYSQYTSLFGDAFISGGLTYSYLTSIAAYNYFNYGGSSLLVARVASGSYTSATSDISNTVTSISGTPASVSFEISSSYLSYYPGLTYGGIICVSFPVTQAGVNTYVNYYLESSEVLQNTYDSDSYYGIVNVGTNSTIDSFGQGIADYINTPIVNGFTNYFNTIFEASYITSTNTLTITAKDASSAYNGVLFSFGPGPQGTYPGCAIDQFTSSSVMEGGENGTFSTAFTLETISQGIIMNNSGSETNGALISGSKDNIRIEISNSNLKLGTFNVLIRQGNDISNKKIILETFNGVNLDPNSNRYISKVIGDQNLSYNFANNQMELSGDYRNNSRYVRVKNINSPTPNYLNSLGDISNEEYLLYLPINSSTPFSNATGETSPNIGTTMYNNIGVNTQGLIGSDYNNMINLFSNKEAFQFNVLFTPGLIKEHHPAQVSTIITNTQDRGDNLYVLDLTDYQGTVSTTITQAQSINNSYAATYWPWVRISDPATGKQVWIPASTVIPGVYAFNDKVSAPWFAPAGINRGGLSTVLQAQYKLTQNNKDSLYSNNINPLATLPKKGVVVFGQKTLQKEQSSLDRVNVRRLLIELKNFIRQIADTVLFEQNTLQTQTSFKGRITPFLESIQQRQGLFAYKILMDASNNGPAVIDQNQLIGQIFIQPTRTAEFISLDFILLPTGAEFPV